ncbi:MAG: hypothetical protein R3C44_06200 [Chloroflexota bacterium]
MGQNPFGPSWSVIVDGRMVTPADVIMSQQETNGCWPNLYGPGMIPMGQRTRLSCSASPRNGMYRFCIYRLSRRIPVTS